MCMCVCVCVTMINENRGYKIWYMGEFRETKCKEEMMWLYHNLKKHKKWLVKWLMAINHEET